MNFADASMSVTVDAPAPLPLGEVARLLDLLVGLRAGVHYTQARFLLTGGLVYTYRLKHADLRTWLQTLTFLDASDIDPAMTWPGDAWRLTEFSGQRAFRDLCVDWRARFAVTKILCDYLA